jgi:ABC-type transporter Mla subunit MlaD
MIEQRPERPAWVTNAIQVLLSAADALDKHRDATRDLAIVLRSAGVDTSELDDAAHDLQHAWRHVAAARRALVMTWPVEAEKEEPGGHRPHP